LKKNNPGGQASSSARIENYLGFPSGLSGAELTRRAISQTTRFGTEILTPKEVKDICVKDGYKIIEMTDGSVVHSKSIIIATGASYATLSIEGIEKFTGAGIYYGSAAIEAHACKNEVIYIIGGGKLRLPGCHVHEQVCQRSEYLDSTR
jgi:thioredoxin reductase (NADPH)